MLAHGGECVEEHVGVDALLLNLAETYDLAHRWLLAQFRADGKDGTVMKRVQGAG